MTLYFVYLTMLILAETIQPWIVTLLVSNYLEKMLKADRGLVWGKFLEFAWRVWEKQWKISVWTAGLKLQVLNPRLDNSSS